MNYIAPTAIDRDNFHSGKNCSAYTMLGSHPVQQDGVDMWHFSVWAPNAKNVSIVGYFNQWNLKDKIMHKQYDGIWELRIPFTEIGEGFAYKFAIETEYGEILYKADPYAFYSELRPNTASLTYNLDNFIWHDIDWMNKRSNFNPYSSAINIYEVHLGSWKRHDDGSFLTYRELAIELVSYVKNMGYTHVEILPIMEHPLDMSWGYQVSGFYSVTSRFGSPKDFMVLIDAFHQENIGVILDWVPAHFPKDAFALRRFDGTALYEHPDSRRGDMPQWGTHMFDLARGEVCSFLLSNACFWFDVFHVDGIRCDAVSSMLYYDFCKEEGQWIPNPFGGRENLDAINFLRYLNEIVYRDFPGIMMIAEESSTYPLVTKPAYLGGLGFGFKWNMGWMNDILSYIKLDPVYRKYHHDKVTFSLFYAFSENYILPFSHDEVVHGKHSMLDKNPGDLWNKFAGLRALYGFTMAHPGKKLLFMGGEFAHFIEWKFDDQLDWFLLVYDRHPQLQNYVKELNHFYSSHKQFYEVDDSWNGFQWLTANDSDNSVFAFTRSDKNGNMIIIVSNFTPVFHPIYKIGLPCAGRIKEIFNSDLEKFGGSNQYNAYELDTIKVEYNGLPFSVDICVPPMASVYFDFKICTDNIENQQSIEIKKLDMIKE